MLASTAIGAAKGALEAYLELHRGADSRHCGGHRALRLSQPFQRHDGDRAGIVADRCRPALSRGARLDRRQARPLIRRRVASAPLTQLRLGSAAPRQACTTSPHNWGKTMFSVVLRGLVPRIHVFVQPLQGVDAHGSRPWDEGPRHKAAKTKLGARCPFLHGCEIFPRTTQQLGGGGRVRGLLRYRLFDAASDVNRVIRPHR
jgi:hypothetical protein